MIEKKNYDKFIFKGALALESYFDDNNENLKLFEGINEKLKKYRSIKNKKTIDSELIVKELLALIEQLGKENFIIYDDGDIEYIYKNMRGDDFDVRE